jgi:hypothetical protein
MTRTNPEARLQIEVKQYLVVALPPSILWTASMAGVHVHIRTATRAKSMGVQRGWPDLQFLFPDGVTRYIELKAGSTLSPEQKAFRAFAAPLGIHAVCRSLPEVDAQLRAWGAPMRAHPFYPELAA